MADKDNANPIVYSQSTQPSHRESHINKDEWWRDSILTPALSVGPRTYGGSDSGYGEDDYEEDIDVAPLKNDSLPVKDSTSEDIDQQEVFGKSHLRLKWQISLLSADLVRSISDPEHPLTLEQLAVVNAEHIIIDEGDKSSHRAAHILLEFTPTIPHCSMATLIGLALRVRLLRSLPSRYKVDIRVRPGTHQSENAVNKQLNDKERVAAALENQHLLGVVSDCLATAGRRGATEEEAMRRADDLAIELGITSA